MKDFLTIHVSRKSCAPEIVFVLTCTLPEQFYVREYYKMCESTLSSIVNFEENIDLSHIHLAVQVDMAVESGPEHMYQRKPGSLTPTSLQ